MSGYVIEIVALVTVLLLAIKAFTERASASLLIPVALFAGAVVPFVAFYEGHPYRMRYMVPLVAACALFGGVAVGVIRRPGIHGRAIAAILIGATLFESPPLNTTAALLEESQWDVPLSRERRAVTSCLSDYRGEKVLASMASLAHYMQELSHEGFRVVDFVHEGNGSIWELALETGPAPHVGWMLVEEKAENGDVLEKRIRQDPSFARGMTRVCEGGGVALYRRQF